MYEKFSDSELAKTYKKVLDENPGNNEAIEAKVIETVNELSELTGMPSKVCLKHKRRLTQPLAERLFLDDQYTVFGQVILRTLK